MAGASPLQRPGYRRPANYTSTVTTHSRKTIPTADLRGMVSGHSLVVATTSRRCAGTGGGSRIYERFYPRPDHFGDLQVPQYQSSVRRVGACRLQLDLYAAS